MADIPICGDLDLKIGQDGTWFYKNSPITRQKLVKLFAGALCRDADGVFWLITPIERCRVMVEDAPFLAVEMRKEGEGSRAALDFRTNIGEWIELGPDHSLQMRKGIPYVKMDKNLEAKINRPLYYDLVDLAEKVGQGFFLWSRGKQFSLGTLHETK